MAALWAVRAAVALSLPAQVPAIRLEARAGVALSSPLAEADVVHDGRLLLGGATLQPGALPYLGASVLHPVAEDLALELSAAFARGGLSGEGPEGSWDAGELSVMHGVLAVRYRPRVRWLYGRAGAGLIVYRGSELAILREGSDTGILLAGALGVRPPLGFPVRLELEVQGHSFGSVAFRREGGVDGNVVRLLIGIVAGRGGGP